MDASPPAGVIDLRETVVLLTGGSRGIGAAAVRALRRAGAGVFFTYRERAAAAEALAAELGDGVAAYRLDVADGQALPGAVDACVARFGALDVLVNNAAIFAENPFDGDDYAAWRAGWRRTFDVNLFSAADLAWLAMRVMRGRGGGAIVNVASRAAHRGELSFADYGASKAALVNLTKSIARGCARDGITAYAVAPGFVATEMAEPDLAERGAEIAAEVPLGRVASADEVAHVIAFLCTPLARHLNGATIDVNGGSYVR
ncbi:MAG TPA: SDR family oxidoreductase [Candidatus Elarobacter sp.]|nr:SDR family oxidoreductase [Candidatus Elarobacter sp.]